MSKAIVDAARALLGEYIARGFGSGMVDAIDAPAEAVELDSLGEWRQEYDDGAWGLYPSGCDCSYYIAEVDCDGSWAIWRQPTDLRALRTGQATGDTQAERIERGKAAALSALRESRSENNRP